MYPDDAARDSPLMVLETPLLRVSRPVAACSRCRSAKVKCDGKLPACTACEKANRAAECSSTNDQFARGKERSYVATLEARVEKLEKRLHDARSRRRSSVTMTEPDAHQSTPRSAPAANVSKATDKAARRKEEDDINDLVSDFGLLSVNATARDFYGFTSAMSYARLILSASSKEPLPSGMAKSLPPRYAITSLIQHYLDSMFVLLPILDETSFYGSVDAVYQPDQRKAGAFDFWTLRMVLAISSISYSEQRGDVHYSDAVGHVNAALEHAEDVLRPGSVASIQAMLLLAQYSMLDPHHFDSWTLVGAASRAMVDLGMHVDPSKSASMSKPKLELRRRVYHCLYAIDRETSLVQTRSFSFSDDSAHVGLPFSGSASSASKASSSSLTQWGQSFESALDLFRLRQIQSAWYTDLFQSERDAWPDPYPRLWRIYNSMTSWFMKLSQKISPASRTYFELELLYSYVYALSPSPRCPRINEYAQRLIFEHCATYSSRMLGALSEDSSEKMPVTFYDAMRAYMTGRQFVDVVSRNQESLLEGPRPIASRATSTSTTDDYLDPASSGSEALPPPFPEARSGGMENQAVKAINTINNFSAILARLGNRFGYINWRDRFQQDSAALLTQLYVRSQQQKQDVSNGYAMWSATGSPGTESMSGSSPATYFDGSTAGGSQSYGYSDGNNYRQLSPGWPESSEGSNRRVYQLGQLNSGTAGGGATVPVTEDMSLSTAWETLPGGSMNARFS
ncbi:zn 2cys6 cluster transcripitional activator [Diplodia corticola]|uniref:Zn 2cys6 cluster transcripitional activator n=1 Tax=Diplodia corticola TaxID=236234 RepID=A0A1J9R2H4_9PEZI|nr:zn 2cys6 cluster transcripitional activator [Diplodia corticola]OJD35598.1 zn 2cys6 cluster transcripitional activator [Diplodia corticola]